MAADASKKAEEEDQRYFAEDRHLGSVLDKIQMVNEKIDKLIAGVAKIESWVRLVKVACLSFLEIVRWGVYEPMNK